MFQSLFRLIPIDVLMTDLVRGMKDVNQKVATLNDIVMLVPPKLDNFEYSNFIKPFFFNYRKWVHGLFNTKPC